MLGSQILVPNADDPNAKRVELAVPLKIANRMALLLVDGAVQLDREA
ncbi:MAG TPA: hypothetical protein PK948_03050 [Gemmatimonadales bacterium]|nr:hypothetical protein [Gemmatimonadales bacterium]